MRYCLNYSGTRFLSTENWNYSISWWNSSDVFVIKGLKNLPLVPTIPSLWIIRLWWYSLTLITPLLSGVFVNKLLSANTTTVGMLLTSSSRKALVYMYCYKVKENIHYKHIVSQSLLNAVVSSGYICLERPAVCFSKILVFLPGTENCCVLIKDQGFNSSAVNTIKLISQQKKVDYFVSCYPCFFSKDFDFDNFALGLKSYLDFLGKCPRLPKMLRCFWKIQDIALKKNLKTWNFNKHHKQFLDSEIRWKVSGTSYWPPYLSHMFRGLMYNHMLVY